MSRSVSLVRLVSIPTALALVFSICAAATAAPARAAPSASVMVAEVYGGGGNSGATLTNDFIELGNAAFTAAPVDTWSVQYLPASPSAASQWQVTPLTGSVPAGGRYLIGEAQGAGGTTPLPTTDAGGTIAMSGTGGTVALVNTTTPLTCKTAADCAADARIVDLVGYGAAVVRETSPTAATSNTTSAARPGLVDTDNNSNDFTVGAPTPQNSRELPPPDTGCDVAPTHQIGAVQGMAASSPVAGQTVRVEGVVTGDFNDGSAELGGIYIQDDTPDDDPLSSEGIFIPTSTAVSEGDRVLVSGTAAESNGQTQLSGATVDVCGTGTIAPLTYDLPRPSDASFEPVESMLLTFPEALTATELFQLGRFGEVTVSSDGRLFQPTDRLEPGPEAQALADLNARRRLLIDDTSNLQNPTTVPFLSPDAVRIGDSATGITGVLGFGFNLFRLQPTDPITFARTNPRPSTPTDVGGNITVASFNTLNYFTTLTTENPDARGANSAEEFARQQAKEVAALIGIDADIVGLMEIENNGAIALESLVDALNEATAPGTYAYITEPALNAPNEFGGTFGTDAIKVALIYRPASVTPVGAAQTSSDPVFDRPPLIQTFEPAGGGEDVTVVVNHFKSKNCAAGSAPGDADQGDGQSCFNERRMLQAQALLDALGGLEAPNPLIIGDLNSYTEEDPIHLIEDAGYTGLSELYVPTAERYSFVFDGLSGELDHALAGPDLMDNVTGATIWHINADEALILDYNLDFGRDPSIYQPDAYRSSDHDPLIVGLSLAQVPAAPEVTATAGIGSLTVEWTEPDDGGSAIIGYEVTLSAAGSEVDSVSVGAGTTSHTFSGLSSGVTYTAEVVASNMAGSGPAGSDSATPSVPRKYAKLTAELSCPSFTVTNTNDFPISFSWSTTSGDAGTDFVEANATVELDVVVGATKTTLSVLVAGKVQTSLKGRC